LQQVVDQLVKFKLLAVEAANTGTGKSDEGTSGGNQQVEINYTPDTVIRILLDFKKFVVLMFQRSD